MKRETCGTLAGVKAHQRNGEPACPDCNDANNAYMRDYRRHRMGRGIPFPVEAPRHDVGLGATIARAIRESA
jgi:hypothetical protein